MEEKRMQSGRIEHDVAALNRGLELFRSGAVSDGLRLIQKNALAVLIHSCVAEAQEYFKANDINMALIKCSAVLMEDEFNQECLDIVKAILRENPRLKVHLHQYGINIRVAA